MPHYADVAIPTGVDKTFTYLIPDPLVPSARAGVRVLVPFGKKTVVGIIVGLARTHHRAERPPASWMSWMHRLYCRTICSSSAPG